MTQEIYSSISVNGFSNHRDLERLCLLFAHDVLDWINEGGLPEEVLHYGEQDSRFGLQKEKESVQTVQVGDIRMDVLFSPHTKRDSNHGLNLLAEQLKAAKESIDMALFVFSAEQLTNVLREKIEQGFEIRLVADPGFASRPFSEVLDLLGVIVPDHTCKVEAGNQPLDQALKGVGSPRLARGDKLHHKFAVIDNKTVISGSFNRSPSAAHTNDETLLVIHSPQLA